MPFNDLNALTVYSFFRGSCVEVNENEISDKRQRWVISTMYAYIRIVSDPIT